MVRTRTAVLKVDDHAVEGVSTNKAKGEKMIQDLPMNSAQRRTLGDITNLPNQKMMLNHGANQQQQSLSLSEKLQKANENMRLMKALTERKYETCDYFVYVDLLLMIIVVFFVTIVQSLRGLEVSCRDIGSTYRWCKHRTCSFPRPTLVSWRRSEQAKTKYVPSLEPKLLKHRTLKALQHELSCKNGVLMARKLPLEPQKLPCTHHDASEDKDRANASHGASGVFHPNGEDHKAGKKSNEQSFWKVESRQFRSIRYNWQTRRVSTDNQYDQESAVLKVAKIAIFIFLRVSLRRQSRRFNIQELGVTENFGIHDDQESAAKAGCSASDLSIGSKPETVELHDTKEITGRSRRVSSRRHSTEVTSQRDIKVSTDPPLHDDIVEESSQVSSSVSTELKRESKNKPTGDEAEEMRETYVGRPSRQAAGKIKSYKEVSLKDKMRRDF
ncbi:hypothetical protein YC2023_013091 [Brassica napus]